MQTENMHIYLFRDRKTEFENVHAKLAVCCYFNI